MDMEEKKYYAHVKEISPSQWETHPLLKHLKDTANLAGSFAELFDNKDWAELSGFWHDLGKYLPDWQAYLCRKSGYSKYDPEAHIETGKGRPNHSTTAAVLSFDKMNKNYAIARILAYITAGHHAGLPDWYPDNAGGDLQNRIFKNNKLNTEELDIIKQIEQIDEIFLKKLPATPPLGRSDAMNYKEHFHLWIRMLFSCLVDADYLDTELFMKPEQAGLRTKYPEFAELSKRFDFFMERKQNAVDSTPINEECKKILNAC
jgi:CRISPR-associated endonuclease/helicase Cas3